MKWSYLHGNSWSSHNREWQRIQSRLPKAHAIIREYKSQKGFVCDTYCGMTEQFEEHRCPEWNTHHRCKKCLKKLPE